MKVKRQSFVLITAAFAAAMMLSSCTTSEKAATSATVPAASTTGAKTLENLQTAFDGESNANAKYSEFAKKADAEGYTKVASLFRAAARAEEIHLKNHAEVIKKMGGTPKADIKLPEIKTTAENLKGAIEGETYERDKMYVDFLAEARNVGNKDAVRTFNLAKAAEAEHAKLYGEALANLGSMKGGTTTYYVCSTCGYTTPDAKLEKCPVDFTTRDKFEEFK